MEETASIATTWGTPVCSLCWLAARSRHVPLFLRPFPVVASSRGNQLESIRVYPFEPLSENSKWLWSSWSVLGVGGSKVYVGDHVSSARRKSHVLGRRADIRRISSTESYGWYPRAGRRTNTEEDGRGEAATRESPRTRIVDDDRKG